MPLSKERMKMRRHVRQRAFERYGPDASTLDLDLIVRLIREGRAIFIRQDTKRVKLYDVPYVLAQSRMVVLRVVYDTKRREVITLKPPA